MRLARRFLSSGGAHSSSKQYFDRGEQLLSQGKNRAATLNFEKSLQHTDDSSVELVVKNRLAFSVAQMGDLERAEDLYLEIEESAGDDKSVDPLMASKANVAAIQSQRGNFSEALESLESVLAFRVEEIGAYALETLDCQIDVAQLKHVTGEMKEAEQLLKLSLKVILDNEYYEELGDACTARLLDIWDDKRVEPDVQVVKEHFELSKELASGANLKQFGAIFLRLQDNDMVIEALSAASARDPRDRELSQNLAILLVAEGRHLEAADTLQTALDKNPSPQYLLRTLHLLSECYAELERWQDAEDTLKKIYSSIKKNKANEALQDVAVSTLKRLADVSVKLEKPNQAKYYMQAAVREAGDNEELAKTLESKD